MKCILSFVAFFFSFVAIAQPLNIPTSLSGNYGELRTGRFHAGIDYRVGGTLGERIHSVSDGYIYRLTVSPSGYGNAVYIKHRDGIFSIYGHMLDFAPELQKRVKQEQYRLQSFSVSVMLQPSEFPVKKGDFIGRVGNSGASGAPHLHFELRNNSQNSPLNPIARGYEEVVDNIAPVIREVRFYSCDTVAAAVSSRELAKFSSPTRRVIALPKQSFVAIDAYDRQDGTNGKLGINRYTVYLDTVKIYSYEIGEYEFSDSKYFNSLIHYPARIDTRRNFIKSYVEPGNMISDKIYSVNNGLIVLKDSDIHVLKIELVDEFGNRTIRKFNIRRKDTEPTVPDSFSSYTFMPWFTPNIYLEEGFSFVIPPGSLYNSINFAAKVVGEGDYSPVWKIHTQDVALVSPARVGIVAKVPERLRDKAVVAKVGESGWYSSCGGSWKDSTLSANIYSFGNYTVVLDTIAPTIKPRFKSISQIKRVGQFAFTIKDNLSGIADFNVKIDGEWVLAQFDAKWNKLWVVLSGDVKRKNDLREVVVRVTDNKKNINEYKFEILW